MAEYQSSWHNKYIWSVWWK